MFEALDVEATMEPIEDVVTKLSELELFKGEAGARVKVEGHQTKRGYVKTYYRKTKGGKDSEIDKDSKEAAILSIIGVSLSEFKENPIEGFVYDPKLDEYEHRAQRSEGKTHLSTAWFDFDKEQIIVT